MLHHSIKELLSNNGMNLIIKLFRKSYMIADIIQKLTASYILRQNDNSDCTNRAC